MGAAHIGAYMAVMWTGSARMAPVAFGLGRLPSQALQAAPWIAWVCNWALAVTSRSQTTLKGTVERAALQPCITWRRVTEECTEYVRHAQS